MPLVVPSPWRATAGLRGLYRSHNGVAPGPGLAIVGNPACEGPKDSTRNVTDDQTSLELRKRPPRRLAVRPAAAPSIRSMSNAAGISN